jgi:hypothetical protein
MAGLQEAKGLLEALGDNEQHLENLRRNAQRIAPLYGPLVGLPVNNSASNFAGAANAHVQNPPLTQVAHAWSAEPPRGWAGMLCWRGGRSRVSTRHGSSREGNGIAGTHRGEREAASQKNADRGHVCTGLSRSSTKGTPPRSPPCGLVCRTGSAARAWTCRRFRMCLTMWPNSMRWPC